MIVLEAPDPLRPCMDIVASLRALADRLEGDAVGVGAADVALVVLSRRGEPVPECLGFGREVREAEVSGLLLQAAMARAAG